MNSRLLLAASVAAILATGATARADQAFTATLAGHSILKAESYIAAPGDAPDDLKVSGKFTAGTRVDAVGTVMGRSSGRPTGVSVPMRGQPLQGFSGIKNLGDGTFLALSDNGFGSKANSPDAMLMFHRLRPNFATGETTIPQTVFLHDPDKKVPFRIANEGTAKRYLTGSDFDIESIQPIGTKRWFGDEFGPYLIRTNADGKVEAVFETMLDGKPVRSPDHYAVTTPGRPDMPVAFNLPRSRGYEGMAASKDGKFLYALLEGPMWDVEKKELETLSGKQYLRILEFDVT
ncbi:MAG: esterase-like activity of phytase family protein, partial [Beijerinckiaceae bacterium]